MTWLHCSIKDGTIVSCSTDEDFNEENASEQMRCHFVNIKTDMTIDEARKYKCPLLDKEGHVLAKRQWKIDLDTFVPAKHRDKIEDRSKQVPLIHEVESRRTVEDYRDEEGKTKQRIKKHCAKATDVTKIR